MQVDVKVPTVGESINEGVIVQWFKKDGELVKSEEPLFELETDKITMNVQSQSTGRLSVKVSQGATVTIGQVVGAIDTDAADAAAEKTSAPPVSAAASVPALSATAPAPSPTTSSGSFQTSGPNLSPAVRRIVTENNLNPAQLVGTGKDGRLTKADVLDIKVTPATPKVDALAPTQDPVRPRIDPSLRETRRPMTSLRRRLAQRLVEAQHNAAILSTFNECDMSAVMALRKRYQESFEKRYGLRLGMMSFFIKAAVEALRAVPAINARIDGEDVIENHYYDIGVAVSTEHGLVVPVLRDVDQMSFAQIEQTLAAYADKARQRKLELTDLMGGCFTVSNGGIYGSLLSTPIINPPQSGILGMHTIKKRPVVIDDKIEIRPMMYLAMSYDHRLVDGQQAVTFLKRIADCIESPERLMLEI